MKETTLFSKHGLDVVRCDDMGPDDGNPFFVQLTDNPNMSASVACALGEGLLGDSHKLTRIQLEWLGEIEDQLE